MATTNRVTMRRLRPRHLWRRSPFWLKLLEVTSVVVVAAVLGNWATDGDSLAGWLEAVSTLAAVLAAMYAGLYAANAWKLESAREDKWMHLQRREQASRIAGWPGELRPHAFAEDSEGNVAYRGFEGLDLNLRNASDVPVTRVRADVTLVIDTKSDTPVRVPLGSRHVVRVLEPTSTPVVVKFFADEVFNPSRYAPGSVEIAYWCEVSLGFRDAGGRDWERLADGQLLLVQDAGAHDIGA